MDKEIKILIGMCLNHKESYTSEELSSFLKLKFKEGVYPYLNKLLEKRFIEKEERGVYKLNNSNQKISDIKFIVNIFKEDSEILFTIHTKRILEKFSSKPVLKTNELPYHNLVIVKDIAKKTRIIYSMHEGNINYYFIRTWEEPTRRLLDFFDIKIKFDEDEFKNKVVKSFSAFTKRQKELNDSDKAEKEKENLNYYLEGKDFILNKLQETDFPVLNALNILTENKKKEFTNPFEITKRIIEWKMKYIYNTDKIEGNALSMEEVRSILSLGAETVQKEKKEILETVNSRTALDNIFDTSNVLNIDFIKKLHLATQIGIDDNAGNFKIDEVVVTDHNYELLDRTTPVKFTAERMQILIDWYNQNKNKLHPLVLASIFHNQFVYIHPFHDGNGRVARLLFNFILIKHGFFPIIFYNDDKNRYYNHIRTAKNGDVKQFVYYCLELYREQLEVF